MKVILALGFILAINMLLFFSQTGVDALALESGVPTTNFFTYEGSLIASYDEGNGTYILTEDISGKLPSDESTIEPDSTNIFTDAFRTVKNWFLETTGLGYLVGIVTAFPNFLKTIGLPTAVAFGLGFFWHALTFFLVVAFIKGNY